MAVEPDFRFGEAGFETMKNVFKAFVADFAEMEKRPDEDHLVREMEKYLGMIPSLYRMGIVWILRALEMAPLAMGFRRQFSNLDIDDQVKVLDAFEKSNNYLQRGIALGLKSIIIVIYFSEPEVEHALGYDHRCLLHAKGQG